MNSTNSTNNNCDGNWSSHDINKYVALIEKNCQSKTFEESIKIGRSKLSNFDSLLLDDFIKNIRMFPSVIIQAKIELESLCVIDLSALKPAQFQKLSKLKRELICIINQTSK